jgi:hypothetical protein
MQSTDSTYDQDHDNDVPRSIHDIHLPPNVVQADRHDENKENTVSISGLNVK